MTDATHEILTDRTPDGVVTVWRTGAAGAYQISCTPDPRASATIPPDRAYDRAAELVATVVRAYVAAISDFDEILEAARERGSVDYPAITACAFAPADRIEAVARVYAHDIGFTLRVGIVAAP